MSLTDFTAFDDRNVEVLSNYLETILLLSNNFLPIILTANPGTELIEQETIFSDGLDILLTTYLHAFEKTTYETFVEYIERYLLEARLLPYKKRLTQLIEVDPKTKYIKLKPEYRNYDPILIFNAVPKVRNNFLEAITTADVRSNNDADIVIGKGSKKVTFFYMDRNLLNLQKNDYIKEVVNFSLEKISQMSSLREIVDKKEIIKNLLVISNNVLVFHIPG